MNYYKQLKIAILTLVVVILLGTIGFYYIEGYSVLDALSVTLGLITTTSIGYGTLVPSTISGKIFTLILVIFGISMVAYAFGSIVSLILEGHIKNLMGRSKMNKSIAGLRDHIILIGAGRVGRHVISRLKTEHIPFVVIDQREETIKKLMEEGVLAIHNDGTKDEVVIEAGIHRAKGLITALPEDADNVFVTLTAKELNPTITVVARADMAESAPKLKRAGADKVISPAVIGGRRMAISILKPVSVEFVETLINKKDVEFELEEIMISDGSEFIGKALKDSKIRQETGSMVVAIKREDDIITNPGADEVIHHGDLLIAIGTREQLGKLENMASC